MTTQSHHSMLQSMVEDCKYVTQIISVAAGEEFVSRVYFWNPVSLWADAQALWRCSWTCHNHSHRTPVPVIRDPSNSEGKQKCHPRVWYSPEIDASKFTPQIHSVTPGGFQWLQYICWCLYTIKYWWKKKLLFGYKVSVAVYWTNQLSIKFLTFCVSYSIYM